MNVTVVGLGKIGLPLAVQFARSGMTVIGADTNPAVVDLVNAGQEPFPGEAHLGDYLAECVAAGTMSATTDTADAVSRSHAVVVVVPLFVDADARPDFGWMDSATEAIGRGLRSENQTLVCYETTLPVGTTRTRWKPMLEHVSGLVEGVDFDLVFSPERVLTGRVFADLRRYPKLVGGLGDRGAHRAVSFYEQALQFDERVDLSRANGVWDLGSAEAAEMAKLAETTYRDVNIGLANQFARFAAANGIDIHKVIEASNSQPYSHLHQPGMSVGGHCIPVYPRLYLWNDPTCGTTRMPPSCEPHAPRMPVCRHTPWAWPRPLRGVTSPANGSSCWGPPTAGGRRRPPSRESSPQSTSWRRAARWSWCMTRCIRTRSWPGMGGLPITSASRSTSPSSTPTTRSMPR